MTLHHNHHHHDTKRGTAMARNRRRLAITLVLAAGYMLAEIAGGLWTGSLALLADAGHMAGDVAALLLSFFAIWIADRPASPQRTYGYYRAEILAALVNGAALIAVSLYIFVEAYHRFHETRVVLGGPMMLIALGGLAVNLVGLVLLHGGRHESLNIRGAWLHVVGDALGSVAAIVAGILIYAFHWYWADPLVSFLIGLLIIYSSWHLLAESVAVLMESAPAGIDVDEVRSAMNSVSGVVGLHDLHIWTITSGLESLSAHVAIEEGHSHAQLLAQLRTMLYERFGIDHITIQIEPVEFEEHPTCP